MTDKLLPCPFCGGESRVGHDTSSDYERQWSWNVECRNVGECEAAIVGFASQEAAIARWNMRTLPAYTHRNGETTAPTVPGQYWFNGRCHGATIKEMIPVIVENKVTCAWRPSFGDGWLEDIENFSGQWWGPVFAPWTVTNVNQ